MKHTGQRKYKFISTVIGKIIITLASLLVLGLVLVMIMIAVNNNNDSQKKSYLDDALREMSEESIINYSSEVSDKEVSNTHKGSSELSQIESISHIENTEESINEVSKDEIYQEEIIESKSNNTEISKSSSNIISKDEYDEETLYIDFLKSTDKTIYYDTYIHQLDSWQILDLDGDGEKELVINSSSCKSEFQEFSNRYNIVLVYKVIDGKVKALKEEPIDKDPQATMAAGSASMRESIVKENDGKYVLSHFWSGGLGVFGYNYYILSNNNFIFQIGYIYDNYNGEGICCYKSNDLKNNKQEIISQEEFNNETRLKDIEGWSKEYL